MGIKIGYSTGNKERTSNSTRGVKYSSGKDSSIAKGISTGRSGSSKVEVGYSAGQKYGGNCSPDPKNHSKPFKQGGRS